MLEIVFGDSAWGSLIQAQSGAKGKGLGRFGVSIRHPDGTKPDQQEIKAALQEEKAKMQQAWERALPLGGNPADVYGFGLFFSIGDISENSPGPRRQRVLEELWSIYPEMEEQTVEQLISRAQKSLETVLDRWTAGERLRLWYSDHPDELCGMHWLMHHLMHRSKEGGGITLVRLPREVEEGCASGTEKTDWGQVPPWEWHLHLSRQTEASPAFCQGCAQRWLALQQENAPLRAVLNGRLLSVPEAMYDPIIAHEIAAEEQVFHEARLIGTILGKYRLGIGDAWVALRIEEMVKQGILKPVNFAEPDCPAYHRMLKKVT